MKRSALLIGLNAEGLVLLHHKTADAPNNANLWVLMGGSIEEGEEAMDAMKREIKEELDIIVEPVLFKKYIHDESWGVVERNVFSAPILGSLEKLKSAQTEGDDLGFFSQDEMKDMTMNENHRKIIDDFLRSADNGK